MFCIERSDKCSITFNNIYKWVLLKLKTLPFGIIVSKMLSDRLLCAGFGTKFSDCLCISVFHYVLENKDTDNDKGKIKIVRCDCRMC